MKEAREISKLKPPSRQKVAETEGISKEIQKLLMKDENRYVRASLAGNHSVIEEVQLVLLKDSSTMVRAQLAGNENINEKIQLLLAKDEDMVVRAKLATNRNITKRVQETLRQDSTEMVQSWFNKFGTKDKSWQLKTLMIKEPCKVGTVQENLRKLANFKDEPEMQAFCYRNLGEAAKQEGDITAASKYFREAGRSYEQLAKGKKGCVSATKRRDAAECYHEAVDLNGIGYDGAARNYNAAVEIFLSLCEEGDNSVNTAYYLTNAANCLVSLNRLENDCLTPTEIDLGTQQKRREVAEYGYMSAIKTSDASLQDRLKRYKEYEESVKAGEEWKHSYFESTYNSPISRAELADDAVKVAELMVKVGDYGGAIERLDIAKGMYETAAGLLKGGSEHDEKMAAYYAKLAQTCTGEQERLGAIIDDRPSAYNGMLAKFIAQIRRLR